MRAILTGVVATIEAIAVALASLLAVAALAFLVWWLAFDLGAEPSEVFAGAGAAWLLAHFVPLSIDISAETMQLLGFAPGALSFSLSLAPLGLTLVTIGCAVRAGWRCGARGGAGSAGVLGGALGFGAVAGVVHSAVALAQPGWFATATTGFLVYGLSSGTAYLVRAARDGHGWWISLLGAIQTGLARLGVRRPAVFPHRAGQTLRIAVMLLAGYVGAAAIALVVALLSRFTDVIAASEALQLDLWGTILMFVLQLALLPVLVLWSGAWLTGAGFAIGVGSSASPFGQLLGPMPGIPVLAATPDGWGSAAGFAPILLSLVGLAVGVALGEVARRQTLQRLVLQVLLAALLAGLAIALGNWLSSGSLGPGRLAAAGPDVWLGAGLAAAALGVGCLLGALAARADIARRVVAAPTEVVSRLGLGDAASDAASDAAPDATQWAARDAGASAEPGDEPAGERLAPVWPLLRGRNGGRAPAAAGRWRDASAPDPDEHPTEPLDSATFDFGRADLGESGRSDLTGAELPGAAVVPEAELFDQHVAAAAARARDSGPGGQPDEDPHGPAQQGSAGAAGAPGTRAGHGDAAQPAAEIDPEALVEAYSWDNVDLGPAPVEGAKRQGWRWPGRKG